MQMFDKIKYLLTFLPALIYNLFFSKLLSSKVHRYFMSAFMEDTEGQNQVYTDTEKDRKIRVLDIGTGTGQALYSIYKDFGPNAEIIGIDINKNYLQAAKKLFKDVPNVTIQEQNIYTYQEPHEFDIVIFSFSFMLLPDKPLALQKALSMLRKDGKLLFFMTIFNKKIRFLEKLKPFLKNLTSMDFGDVVYEQEFKELMFNAGITIDKNLKVKNAFNVAWIWSSVHVIQCIRGENDKEQMIEEKPQKQSQSLHIQ